MDKKRDEVKKKSPPIVIPTPTRIERERSFLPMVHGKAIDKIAVMTGKKADEDILAQTGTYYEENVRLVIQQFNKLSGILGVSTHKLLSTAVTEFTKNNDISGKSKPRELRVSFSLKQYAEKCGYDVEPRITGNSDEALKEEARVRNNINNARRKIKKDLDLLFNTVISWSERVRGREENFTDVRIISAKSIKNGMITIEFSMIMAEYLVKLPVTQYSVALLKLDERNSNAYNMGLKLAEHYSMNSVKNSENAELLKVKSILKVTNLPDIDKVKTNKNSWEQRIKEPFENNMEILVSCGLLLNWEYSLGKGVFMEDDQAENIDNYEQWLETLVHFNLKNPPDFSQKKLVTSNKKRKK